MPNVHLLDPADELARRKWDEYVFSCPEATFFHLSAWQKILREVFGHRTYYLYAENSGCICGILPLTHVHSLLFGNSLISIPFAVYGGIVATDSESESALLVAAQELAKKLNVSHLEFRNINQKHADWPTQDLYVTFRKQLHPLAEDNLLAVPRKQRAMIRKGISNGLRSSVERNTDNFFPLFAENVHRHGTPALPRRYFDSLLQEFGSSCEVLTVYGPDDRPLSSVLSFFFRDEILPYYAGDNESARSLAANDFKYWELMRIACERGIKTFDYGRSKRGTGSYSFKKNWGFEPTPLHYEYCLYKRDSIPQNNPSNAKFKLFIGLWRRMPIGLANWLGPYIVRNLG